ncbi:MAG: class I SAM-dependent methyltransferase [Candidatus Aminicenantales bacterium]
MENHHWWFVSGNNLVRRLIAAKGRTFPMILDAASATGANLASLARFGQVFGLDISPQTIEFCRRWNLRKLIRGTLVRACFWSETFDPVTCLDVLKPIIDPLRTLVELKSILEKDGEMVLTFPAFKALGSQHDEALSHRGRYTRKDLRSELERAGLEVEKMGYFFCLSFLIVAPLKMTSRWLRENFVSRSDTITLPQRGLNAGLIKLFNLEIKALNHLSFPFGTTLLAMVKKRR